MVPPVDSAKTNPDRFQGFVLIHPSLLQASEQSTSQLTVDIINDFDRSINEMKRSYIGLLSGRPADSESA